MTDTEIRIRGVEALAHALGSVEAERFITLILREPFDYTTWRQPLFEHLSLEEISDAAMAQRNKS